MGTPADKPSPLRWAGLPPRIALGFCAAVLSLAAAAGASYAALAARSASSRLARHSTTAQLAIEEIESALLAPDLALQADVASAGTARHRDRVVRAAAKVEPALRNLQRISEEHPEAQPLIAQLAIDLDVVRAEQAARIAALDAGHPDAARALEAREAGREAFERALAALDAIRRDEVRAHEGREETWRRNVRASHAVFVAAVLLLLALVLLEARLVHDDLRRREADRADRERALVLQQQLMAVVSHDLRSPLAAVLAGAGVLARLGLPPEASQLSRRIGSAGRRMERLIRDLLDWSRVQAGTPIPISTREADLHAVCLRMADELCGREEQRIRVEREGDVRGVFDPDRMEQVVGNLLSNALRYAPPESTVVVRAVGTPHEIRVEVRDRGPGISPEARARIFEPFQQGPSGDRGGVGLGLFIVRALAEAHGGAVELDSAPGETSFVVRLPRRASRASAAG